MTHVRSVGARALKRLSIGDVRLAGALFVAILGEIVAPVLLMKRRIR
jgi:hypothetical protein